MTREEKKQAKAVATNKESLKNFAKRFERLTRLLNEFDDLKEISKFSVICEAKEDCIEAIEFFAKLQGIYEYIDNQ